MSKIKKIVIGVIAATTTAILGVMAIYFVKRKRTKLEGLDYCPEEDEEVEETDAEEKIE